VAKKVKKPIRKLSRGMRKKLIVLFSVLTICLCALIGRLMYINYTSGEKYEKKVLSMQSYDSKTIPYQRGDIVDRNGTVLATSVAVYNVIMDCSVMTSESKVDGQKVQKYLEPTIEALVECFPELDKGTLYQYATEKPDSKYIILLKKLPYDKIQSFVQLQEAVDEKGKKVNPNIKGVWFEKEYQRRYPFNSMASATIGFVSSGNVGTIGLENYYNDVLNGINGREYGYLNSESDFEKTVIAPQDGNTLVSTIDANIQSIVEKKILEFNAAYTNNYREGDGSLNTAVIVMNPNTGAILFTVSTISSTSLVSKHIGNASTPANSLNKIAFPSITGIAASGPMSPRPKTAVPSDTTATVFALHVYLYTSCLLSLIFLHGSATPGVYAVLKSSLFFTCTLELTCIFPVPASCIFKLSSL